MKNQLKLLMFAILCGLSGVAQSGKLYDEASVTTKPEFPGGEAAFKHFFDKNFGRVAQFSGQQDEAIAMRYIVETDGKLTEIKPVVMGRITEWHTEAVRVLGLTSKWKPATKDGKPVRCIVTRNIENKYAKNFREGYSDATIEPIGIDPPNANGDNLVYSMAGIEVKPEFPGGMDKFYMYAERNLKVSESRVNGKVYATFIVEKDGSLTDVKIIRDLGSGTGEEIIRLIKSSPKWIPGKQNGKYVRVQYSVGIPINPVPKKEKNNNIISDLDAPMTVNKPNAPQDENKLFSIAEIEQPPQFPGGIDKFFKHFGKSFKMPAEKPDLQGKMFIGFIVEKNGTLSDIKVIRDLGYGTGAQALEIIKKLPNWTPGMHNGKPVRCQYNIPIAIQYQAEAEKNGLPTGKK